MLLINMKLMAILLGTSVSAGRHHMVTRKAQDVYSVPGEGELYTSSCSFSSPRMTADVMVEGGKTWVAFYDEQGELEGECRVVPFPTYHFPVITRKISRGIAQTK